MDIAITPSKLHGGISVPTSKSDAHRYIIASALANGNTVLNDLCLTPKDIQAALGACKAIGAALDIAESNRKNYGTAVISGAVCPQGNAVVDCVESGTTLRLIIPVAAALGVNATFTGEGKLPQRPLSPYIEQMSKHGIKFSGSGLPLTIEGKLTGGEYELEGNISSQFISGLLLALPKCEEDSHLKLLSPLQSKPYVDMTLNCLKNFGIQIECGKDEYFIKGGQTYKACTHSIESDWSQAAFFCVANALGSDVDIKNMDHQSVQGDRAIYDICAGYDGKAIDVDCMDTPDIVPVLSVLASQCEGVSYIRNISRLRLKESDRIETVCNMINSLGGDAKCIGEDIVIKGKRLCGGEVDACNDHRIAMASAIAATVSTGKVIIKGAQCVTKSYPNFFEEYARLGGILQQF